MNFCSLLSDVVPAPYLLDFAQSNVLLLGGNNWTSQKAKEAFCRLCNIDEIDRIYLDETQTHTQFEVTVIINNLTFDTSDYRVCDMCISIARAFKYSLTMSCGKFMIDNCHLNCYATPLLTPNSEVFLRKYFFGLIDLSVNDSIASDIMDVLIDETILPKPNVILNSSK